MYVCICNAITEQAVRDKANRSCFATSYYCKLCKDSCCRCIPRIKEIIHEEKHRSRGTS